MTHEPHLPRALRELFSTRRVAALGTLDAQRNAQPFVSMVPFARLGSEGCLVIHVSGLAAHTRNLIAHPQVSLLVMAAEADGAPVHALPRVTLDAVAQVPERDSPAWSAARAAYLARFPEAEPMTALGDFMFVLLRPTGARQVAGFGAARNVAADELARVLGSSGLGRRAMASQTAYCAAKAGMDHFTRCLALDEALKQNGARVCSLAPGVIDTDMQRQLRGADGAAFPDQVSFASLKASGQLTSPTDAAARVLAYLAWPDFGTHPVTDLRD